MENEWDTGLKEDYDNMTYDLGTEVLVYPRKVDLDYGGQENTDSGIKDKEVEGTLEIVFLQELDSENEAVKAGIMQVGDVRFTFQTNSIVEEEGFVFSNNSWYKILRLTKVRGMTNDIIIYIKAFGRKVPYR